MSGVSLAPSNPRLGKLAYPRVEIVVSYRLLHVGLILTRIHWLNSTSRTKSHRCVSFRNFCRKLVRWRTCKFIWLFFPLFGNPVLKCVIWEPLRQHIPVSTLLWLCLYSTVQLVESCICTICLKFSFNYSENFGRQIYDVADFGFLYHKKKLHNLNDVDMDVCCLVENAMFFSAKL